VIGSARRAWPRRWTRVKVAALRLTVRALAWLPYRVVEQGLAVASVTYALVQPHRVRRALAWAAAHRPDRWGRARLAVSLLAYRGRGVAADGIRMFLGPDELRRFVKIDGPEFLARPAGSRGRLLLVFHLGPLVASLRLAADGHGAVAGARPRAAEWAALLRRDDVPWRIPTPFFEASRAARGIILHQARARLLKGQAVCMAADGAVGRRAFCVSVPGGEIDIGSGWWVLRRLTGAETCPVLAHWADSGMVVTVYPPLPAPVTDGAEDARACQAALGSILAHHVRRYPAQCHALVLGSPAASGREPTHSSGRRS
jgi:lauroyl/myristoyl acyltransferase